MPILTQCIILVGAVSASVPRREVQRGREPGAMPASKRWLIKKYSNRKLYDTERRKFTTIDDLAALVESGVDVQVVDHDTGVDRTDEVLVQLVRRKVQTKPESSSLFSELVRAPADVAQSLVDGLTTISNLPEEAKLPGRGRARRSSEPPPKNNQDQQEEIRELREQIAKLTEVVAKLVDAQSPDDSAD